jgi:hypothetical protein
MRMVKGLVIITARRAFLTRSGVWRHTKTSPPVFLPKVKKSRRRLML